uniref:Uncharacterized protein n=1 Tax=Oryza meridionalis TaxID=40149 RepID=A0A0E0DSY6_9ORYZ
MSTYAPWYLIPGTLPGTLGTGWYRSIPDTWYLRYRLVPDTWYLWYRLGIDRYLIPDTWYLRYRLVPGTFCTD